MYFASLLRGQHTAKALSLLNRAHLAEEWQSVYDYVLAHVRSEGRLPHAETVELACKVILPMAPEELGFYAQRIRENAMRQVMEDGFVEHVVTPLTNQDPRAALAGAKEVTAQVHREFRELGSSTLDYASNVEVREADYDLRAKAKGAQGYPTPYDALTRATGGMLPGEVWVLAARPNMGKSFLAILFAVLSYMYGLRVMFCSMETPAQGRLPKDLRHRLVRGECIRCRLKGVNKDAECMASQINRQRLSIRFDALGAGISPWRFMSGCMTPQERERMGIYWKCVADPASHGYGWGDLRIVAPPDVRTLVDLELEVMDYRPDLVVWDSAYLGALHTSGGSHKRKDAYDDLLMGFHDLCDLYAIPGLLTWHFSRDVDEKATGASLADTAYTDELGRLTDVVLGLFRPPNLQDAREALMRTLKVRDGVAMRELRIEWDIKEGCKLAQIAEGTPPPPAPAQSK